MSEIGFEQRQVCVAISERPGQQFGQTRMISVLTLALAVGVVGFFLFKKHWLFILTVRDFSLFM